MVNQILKKIGICLAILVALSIVNARHILAQEKVPLAFLIDAINPTLYDLETYLNYYALAKGKVQAEGVKLDLKPFWIWDATRLMVAGQGDVGVMTLNSYLMAKDRAVPLFMIAVAQMLPPDMPSSGNAMFSRVASGIKTLKDLEGKKVGIPGLLSASAIYHRAILQYKYGTDTSKITWVDKGTPELLTLLKQGDIDAANLFGSVADRARKEPGFQLLYLAPDAWKEMTGMPFITVIVAAKKSLVEKYPQVLKSLLIAVKLSKKYGEDHRNEIVTELTKEFGSLAPPSMLSTPFELTEEHKEAVKLYMKYSLEQKVIRKEIDPSALFADLK